MRVLERLFPLLLGIVLVLLCWQPLQVGSDFWAHAAVGRWIVTHRAIPREALFIWTYSGAWMAHSWLSEVACYGLMQLGGAWGGPILAVMLTALTALLIFAIALWPSLRSSRRLPLLIAAAAFLAMICCMDRFVPRPELLTTLCTVALYNWLSSVRAGRVVDDSRQRRRLLVGLPVLFAVWTNLHGAVIYGLAALWLMAACDYAQYRDALARTLVVAGVLSAAAILVNPYGARYLLIYTPLAHHSFYYIGEWLPFWVKPRVDIKLPIYELALTIIAFLVWLLNRGRRWSFLAWLLMSAAAFVQARRNMDLLALTALVVIARNYSGALAGWLERRKVNAEHDKVWRVLATTGAGLLTVNLLWMGGVVLWLQSGGAFIRATRQALPTQQAAVVQRITSPRLHVLNLYNSAAYLEWQLGESAPLYIDGLNAYPDDVYRTWRRIWEASPAGIDDFQRSGVNCVMADHIAANTYMPNLINVLAVNPDWVMIYNGSDGSVLVRRELLARPSTKLAAVKLSLRRTAT